MFDRISAWWRRLPQKTRVHLIASALLVFAGTEIFVLAPYLFDIALIIDVGGLTLVLAALRSSMSASMMQLRALVTAIMKSFGAVMRAGERITDFGSAFFPRWYRHYFLLDRIATRCSAAFLIIGIGLGLTKALITNPWT